MAITTWNSIFHPEWQPGGLSSVNRGVTSRLFDDFELYANNGALQTVWTIVNGGGAVPTLTNAANALKGQQSMETAPTAGPAYVWRAINNNVFGFPAGRHIRYIVFRGLIVTNSDTVTIRLSNVAGLTDGAGIYREWSFTFDNSRTREMYIDLYSGTANSGGYDNTESNPGFSGSNGVWDPTIINSFSFRSLSNGSIYRFDDIHFIYDTFSLIDLIGIGTEPSTDDGTLGSIQSKLRYINQQLLTLLGSTEQYNKYGPNTAYLNQSYTWGLELKGSAASGTPTTDQIIPGNYTIDRVRINRTTGVTDTTNIIASTGATEANAFISSAYTPLEDNWRPGDQLIVTFSGGSIDQDTAESLTSDTNAGTSLVALANAALFQVGQRVRIYDNDDATGEVFNVLSIDSPTQLTLSGSTVNNYTTLQSAALVVVTQLENARFTTRVSYEPELQRELHKWVLADYDDFDSTDVNGDTERWDTVYIANSDGSAAGNEGGTASINNGGTLGVIGAAPNGYGRSQVDPDASPTQAAYALKRDEPSYSRYYAVAVDTNVGLNNGQVTSTFAGIRISAGDVDDANNYVLVAREVSNTVNRFTARAEFATVVQTTQNIDTTDTAVALKIERYGNVYNCFYSLTQYPNWQWVKIAQFEDTNGEMSSITSHYLYAESGGSADGQTAIGDFDNYKYYISVGALDQLLATSILASGTFTNSSATVPADTGRTEGSNFWNGTLLMPITGALSFQPRTIVIFDNAGGVFTLDPENPFTAAPAVGDEYVILAYQYPLEPATDGSNNLTSAHVIGSKTDTALYDVNNTASIVRYLKALHEEKIEATGTADAGSDTNTLRDAARTETDDYWNGQTLHFISGANIGLSRAIVGFAAATDDIELRPAFPNVIGVGDIYVITSNHQEVVPTADTADNLQPRDVIGNKTDTIPVMNAAPANDSLVRQIKAILERVGQTPADPDDSVLTNLGQRDDTATLDDLSDITTTSIQAKLRRLLLRFSVDAFSATVQGVARTDVENMVQGLANYLSSAGAAWAVTANPGGVERNNLEQTLEDFADVLAGGNGIITFPAAVQAGNGVSIAEVLRHVSEAVGEDTGNNTFSSTNITEDGAGSVLERLQEIRGRTTTGTHNIEIAHGTAVQTVLDISPIRHGNIAVQFDLNTVIVAIEGGTITFRLQNMIDGVNLRIIDRTDFLIGTDEVHPTISGFVQEGTNTVRVTIQVNSAVSAQRAVPYRIIESS